MGCEACRTKPVIGSRCMLHYTRRFTRPWGLLKKIWYLAHEKQFVDMLEARFYAVQAGFEPDKSVILTIFEKGTFKLKKEEFNLPQEVECTVIDHIIRRIDHWAKKGENDGESRNPNVPESERELGSSPVDRRSLRALADRIKPSGDPQ